MKQLFSMITFLFWLGGFAQSDSCKVIMVSHKTLNDTSGITESYSEDGIFLLRNAIYNLKISGKTFTNYRILKVWNDSLEIAWTLDSLPSYSYKISEIQKVIFPSLNNGVTGFPHPAMNDKKYRFKMSCRAPYELKPMEVCLDSDCDQKTYGYPFVVSGFEWKPVIRDDDKTIMIDNQVVHTLQRN